MAGKRKKSSKKGPNSAENPIDVSESPPAKKQMVNFANGALPSGKTSAQRENTIVELDAGVVRKPLMPKGVGFPRFPHGTIYIQIFPLHEKYTYTFDRDLLAHSSSWFAKVLTQPAIEADGELAQEMRERYKVESCFELKYHQKLNTWLLVRVPFTKHKEVETEMSSAINSDPSLRQIDACEIQRPLTPDLLNSSQGIEEVIPDPALLTAAIFKDISGDNTVLDGPTVNEGPTIHESPTIEEISTAEEGLTVEESPVAELTTFSPTLDNIGVADVTPTTELPTETLVLTIAHAENAEKKTDVDLKVVKEEPKSVIKIEELDDITQKETQIETPIESEETPSDRNTISGVLLNTCKTHYEVEKEHDQFTPSLENETEHSEGPVTCDILEIEITTGKEKTPSITSTSEISISVGEGSKLATGNQTESVGDNLKTSIEATCEVESQKIIAKVDTEFRIPLNVCETHHNLFLLFHNMTPEIDTININTALKQIENIIFIAHCYSSVAVVRPHLCTHLFQFGYALFEAIHEDPPRWLQLSTFLECVPIFTEALIHIVGHYPNYPWATAGKIKPASDVLDLIRRKADQLSLLKARINEDLFTSSIGIDGSTVQLTNVDKEDINTWLVVQLWRDWFCNELAKRSSAKHTVGTVYRLLAKGGDAYLPDVSVFWKLRGYNVAKCHLREVEKDLKIMKEFAKKKVEELVVNNSLVDVERGKIEHLTCTTVENDELPWFKKGGGD